MGDIDRKPVLPRGSAEIALMAIVILCGAVVATQDPLFKLSQHWVNPRYAPRAWVDLDEPEETNGSVADEATRRRLRIAIAPFMSPEMASNGWRLMAEYVGSKTGRITRSVQGSTYAAVNAMMRDPAYDLAMVCGYAFVRGEKEFGLSVLVVPQIGGSLMNHSITVVPRASKALSLLDLRGKRFASGDVMSDSAWIFPALWLRDHGEDPVEFFGKHVITRGHDLSLKAVADGIVDAAALSSLVYDQLTTKDPSIRTRTRIILNGPPAGNPPVVFGPHLDGPLAAQLRTLLLEMDEDPAGRRVLAALGIDRFVMAPNWLYDEARAMARSWDEQ